LAAPLPKFQEGTHQEAEEDIRCSSGIGKALSLEFQTKGTPCSFQSEPQYYHLLN
jgi:hypothetical protein